MSDKISITITATDNASKTFEDVVDSAESVQEALDKLDGSGKKNVVPPGVDELPGKLDDVREAADGAATALDNLGGGDKPKQIGWIPPDADKIPATLDDIATAATDATTPIDDMAISAKGFRDIFVDAGKSLPGAAGEVAGALGKVTEQQDAVGNSAAWVAGGLTALAAVLGPQLLSASAVFVTGAMNDFRVMLGGTDVALEAAKARASELDAEILKLGASLDSAAEGLALFGGREQFKDVFADIERLAELQEQISLDWAGVNLGDSIQEADQLASIYGDDILKAQMDVTKAQEQYNQLLKHSGPGAEMVRDRILEMVNALQSGVNTDGSAYGLEQFMFDLNWIQENLNAYDQQALQIASDEQLAQHFLEISRKASDAAISVGLLDTALELMAAAGLNTDATMVALNLSTSALDSTFQTIVGVTNQLAAGSQAVADWAAGLTDVSDGVSKLGRAYLDGRITLDQWSAGVEASTSIQEDNAIIQAEIQAIQAQHLPLLADLTEQQRKYIEGLGDLSAEEQLAALGFMDSAQSAKAMELAYLAADAASGKLGSTGEATAAKIIEAAANADPVMKQMLLDMGLISEGAEGEVTVQFPNATSLTDSVDSLTSSIDALTLALGGIPPSVTTNITATDNATSVIDQVKLALQDLDGSTASVYVATIGGGLTLGVGARDGGVVGYANGGMVMAQLAEVGPELVRLANGGVAIAPTNGLYMVERGSNVMPAEASRAELQRHRQPGGDTHIYSGQVFQPITYEESAYARRRARIAGQRR